MENLAINTKHSAVPYRRTTCLFAVAAALCVTATGHPVRLNFEDIATAGRDGAYVSLYRQYAAQGVTFNNPALIDYSQGNYPISGFAASGVKALEACIGVEFCTDPISIQFTAPQSVVRLMAGIARPLSTPQNVQVTAFNASGAVVSRAAGALPASGSPQPVRIPLEVRGAGIVRVDVGLAGSPLVFNIGLAVDDVEFDNAGPPAPCQASGPPSVTITQPAGTGGVVYLNQFTFGGSVRTSDQIESAQLVITSDGDQTTTMELAGNTVSRDGGSFGFVIRDSLQRGLNNLRLTVRDCGGVAQASAALRYVKVQPPRVFGFELNQGLPLPDYPLVAGKTTLARVYIGAASVDSPSRVDRAELDVVAATGPSFTVYASIPKPVFMNTTQAFTEKDNINFLIPGDRIPGGRYSFRVRLYNDGQLLPAVAIPQTYWFTRTRDVQFAITMPSISYASLDDFAMLDDYLKDLARVLPVRDGWGLLGDGEGGIQVRLTMNEFPCDGTMPFPYCGDNAFNWSAFTWRLFQSNPAGQLVTISAPAQQLPGCPTPPMNSGPAEWTFAASASGGIAGQLFSGPFFYFNGRAGSPAAYDLNYDGVIDSRDLAPYVAEFYNLRTQSWDRDLTRFRPGDPVRKYVDSNRNCAWDPGEPGVPFTNMQFEPWVFRRAQAAADAAGVRRGAFLIWRGLDPVSGGGTANLNGTTLWASLVPWPAFHQEFGHLFGLVDPSSPNYDSKNNPNHSVNQGTYVPGTATPDPRAFNIRTGLAILKAQSVMYGGGLSRGIETALLETYEYQFLFRKFTSAEVTAVSTDSATRLVVDVSRNGGAMSVVQSFTSEQHEPTPDEPGSRYSLVLLDGSRRELARRAVLFGSSSETRVVAPLPAGTAFAHLREGEKVFASIERSVQAPRIEDLMLSRGSGGGARIEVAWKGSHADNRPLTYTAEYSHDAGKTWINIVSVTTANRLTWDTDALPGSNGALIRITASDGFNVSSATTQPFRVHTKPPMPVISEVRRTENGKTQLTAMALDPQEGILSGNLVEWRSDVAGPLGTGRQVTVELEPGRHVITLVARNQNGQSASTTKEVIIE
jgi:hypothetical protein